MSSPVKYQDEIIPLHCKECGKQISEEEYDEWFENEDDRLDFTDMIQMALQPDTIQKFLRVPCKTCEQKTTFVRQNG